MSDHRLSVIIPAAGSSQRLGQAKQLAQLSSKPLLQIAINLAATLQPLEIVVVTGAVANKVQPILEETSHSVPQLKTVHNINWADGIGSSIATGISAINEKAQAAMVLLSDQWKITPKDLITLVRTWQLQPNSLVVSDAGTFTGPPVIFPRDCFAALCKLVGDRGANHVIKANSKRVLKVAMSNASADLDTPEDLKAMLATQALR